MIDSCKRTINCCDDDEEGYVEGKYTRKISSDQESYDEDITEFEEKPKEEKPEAPKDIKNMKIKANKLFMERHQSPWKIYEELEEIGFGMYGVVKKVRLRTNPEIIRAMKIIPEENVVQGEGASLIDEIEILKNLEHPNIMKIYECFVDNNNYYIVSEYCDQGHLLSKLEKLERMDQIVVKFLMDQIFNAVAYLHSKNILHGDIKLENILLFNNKLPKKKHKRNNSLNIEKLFDNMDLLNKNSEIMSSKSLDNSTDDFSNNFNLIHNVEKYDSKLIDFGLYNIFNQRKKINYKDKIDFLEFSAPDILKNNFNEKADIWSCGVIMYYLLSGELPFKGENESETYDKIINGKYFFKNKLFKKISYDAKDLINKCFVYEPSERISSKDALEHSFFKSDKEIEFDNSEIYFSSQSKFFKTILLILIYNCENYKEELIQIKENFNLVDSDNNDKINKEEFNLLIQKLGKENLNIKIEDLNIESFSLFDVIKLMFKINELFSEENLKNIFTIFEINNNVKIPLQEINNLLGMKNNDYKDIIFYLLKELNKTEKDEFKYEEFKRIIEQCIS